MAKEFPGRIHGDGHLPLNESFFSPLEDKEFGPYFNLLLELLKRAGININIDRTDSDLPETLLALRQRLQIAFSNGCPWPEKAIVEDLVEKHPQNLMEIAKVIKEGMVYDGKHSFLFQMLLQSATPSLRQEILTYHHQKRLDGQEDHNLPADITELDGRGVYGQAYDPPYFQSIIPLYKYIEAGATGVQDRFLSVVSFFQTDLSAVNSIDDLIVSTNKFINSHARHVKAKSMEMTNPV